MLPDSLWETCPEVIHPPRSAEPLGLCQMLKQQRIVAMHSWISSILVQPGCWILSAWIRQGPGLQDRDSVAGNESKVAESIWYQSAKALGVLNLITGKYRGIFKNGGPATSHKCQVPLHVWRTQDEPLQFQEGGAVLRFGDGTAVLSFKGDTWAIRHNYWNEGGASLAAECLWYHQNQRHFFGAAATLERLQSMENMLCTDHLHHLCTTWLNLRGCTQLLHVQNLPSKKWWRSWRSWVSFHVISPRSWWVHHLIPPEKRFEIPAGCQVISVVPATLQAGNHLCVSSKKTRWLMIVDKRLYTWLYKLYCPISWGLSRSRVSWNFNKFCAAKLSLRVAPCRALMQTTRTTTVLEWLVLGMAPFSNP